jgi:predicted metal-dependent HD superfamily phosphohydrolase
MPTPEESALTVFSPMDSWIAATGRSDEWLSLGLDLLDRWQAPDAQGADQAHLVAVLAALRVVRPVVAEAPDPLVLAVWFHHAAGPQASLELSAAFAYERIATLGEPELAGEVARLIRQLGLPHPGPDDTAGGLLHTAHRAAMSPAHLAALPPPVGDQ